MTWKDCVGERVACHDSMMDERVLDPYSNAVSFL